MAVLTPRFTCIGGPTVLIEVAGLRLLTDPTFDPAGTEYPTPAYTLKKTTGPALGTQDIGHIDAVLLSHDHHADNLDRAGRAWLPQASRVLTTRAGAERLGGSALGLEPWEQLELEVDGHSRLRITSTPARHGPAGGDRGPVIGFLLTDADADSNMPAPAIWISGDTVWYEGLGPIRERADVRVAVLFLGAARVAQVGPAHLTLAASEGVQAAHAFPHAVVVPVHYEGWEHFSEGRADIQRAFTQAGLGHRLLWLEAGRPTRVPVL